MEVTERPVIDTNCIVRLFVQDDPKSCAVVDRLFERADAGRFKLVVLEGVLAECVFVLSSFYGVDRQTIVDWLLILLSRPSVMSHDVDVLSDALERYRRTSYHFIDCLIAATAVAQGSGVATLDKHLSRFTDVRVAME